MRIVKERVIPAGSGRFTAGTADNVKDYFATVASYIPAEIIAAYTSANGVATVTKYPGFWYGVIFVVCAIGTPIYITRFANTPKEKWYNGIMATLAFLAW